MWVSWPNVTGCYVLNWSPSMNVVCAHVCVYLHECEQFPIKMSMFKTTSLCSSFVCVKSKCVYSNSSFFLIVLTAFKTISQFILTMKPFCVVCVSGLVWFTFLLCRPTRVGLLITEVKVSTFLICRPSWYSISNEFTVQSCQT